MNDTNTTSGNTWTTTSALPPPSSGRVFWHPTEKRLQDATDFVRISVRCTYADGKVREWPPQPGGTQSGMGQSADGGLRVRNTQPRAILVAIYGGAGKTAPTGKELLRNTQVLADGLGVPLKSVLEYEGAVSTDLTRRLVDWALAKGYVTTEDLLGLGPEEAAKIAIPRTVGQKIANDITQRLKAGGGDQAVIILSHSLGAAVATDVANRLAARGLGIDDLILFDRQFFSLSAALVIAAVKGAIAFAKSGALSSTEGEIVYRALASEPARINQLVLSPFLRPDTVRNIGSIWEVLVPDIQYPPGEKLMLDLTAGALPLTTTPYQLSEGRWSTHEGRRQLEESGRYRRQPESDGARQLTSRFVPSTRTRPGSRRDFEWTHGTAIQLMDPYLEILSRWGLATGSRPRLVPINACRPMD